MAAPAAPPRQSLHLVVSLAAAQVGAHTRQATERLRLLAELRLLPGVGPGGEPREALEARQVAVHAASAVALVALRTAASARASRPRLPAVAPYLQHEWVRARREDFLEARSRAEPGAEGEAGWRAYLEGAVVQALAEHTVAHHDTARSHVLRMAPLVTVRRSARSAGWSP